MLFSQEGDSPGIFRLQQIFEAGTDGYYTFRIASMVTTKDGVLLAFAAARKGKGGDWDPINIVLRRSTDYGKTWEPMQVLVADGDLPCDNAMPIVDYETGEVHSLYQIDYARYSMKPHQSKNRILFRNPDSRHIPWMPSTVTLFKYQSQRGE